MVAIARFVKLANGDAVNVNYIMRLKIERDPDGDEVMYVHLANGDIVQMESRPDLGAVFERITQNSTEVSAFRVKDLWPPEMVHMLADEIVAGQKKKEEST